MAESVVHQATGSISRSRSGRSVQGAVALCLAIMLAAPFWQLLMWGTIPDTSWLITVAERMLAGERLYVDLFETNPPFSVWLYLPPVAVAMIVGLSPELVVHLYVYALALLGLGGAALLAKQASFPENPALLRLLPAFLALLVLFPGNSFSERDHIGVALLLPLLVLVAWRADPEITQRPSLLAATLAGMGAAVIVLLKPYYALVVLACGIYAATRRRSVKLLFSPEFLVPAGLCVAYLLAVLSLHPVFFSDVYPILTDVYLKVSPLPSAMLPHWVILALWLALIWRLGLKRGHRPLVWVLAISAALSWVAVFHQGKGWPYHTYPAISLGIGALLCAAVIRGQQPIQARTGLLMACSFAAASWVQFLPNQVPDKGTVAAIRRAVEEPKIAIVSSDLAVGHPLTRMVRGQWVSRHHSDWLPAFASYLGRVARMEGYEAEAARYQAMTERLIEEKMAELVAARPDLVVIERNDRFLLDIIEPMPAFSTFMGGYEPLAEDRVMQVMVRRDILESGEGDAQR